MSCLTSFSLAEERDDLTKQLVWNLVHIGYGWPFTRLLAYCECGENFDLQHAFCKKNGFVSLRHNLVRNITLSLLIEVCEDVRVEPQLQPLTGESFNPSIATGNEVRLLHKKWSFIKNFLKQCVQIRRNLLKKSLLVTFIFLWSEVGRMCSWIFASRSVSILWCKGV